MKLKNIIVALVCTASVLISAVSVNAAERSIHVHAWSKVQTEPSGFRYADETYHKQTYNTIQYCQDYETCGGKKIINTWEEKGTHSWSGADDLGHQGEEYHAFKLKCGACGGGRQFTLSVTITGRAVITLQTYSTVRYCQDNQICGGKQTIKT